MKKRLGFALVELPVVLCAFGLLLFGVAAATRRTSPVIAAFLAIIGVAFCLPLLIMFFLLFPRE